MVCQTINTVEQPISVPVASENRLYRSTAYTFLANVERILSRYSWVDQGATSINPFLLINAFSLKRTNRSSLGHIIVTNGVKIDYDRLEPLMEDTEKNSAPEKVSLCVVCALEEFHYIIGTQETLVITGNNAASFLRNDLGKKLINWDCNISQL
ncbi:hypothetical protein ACTFIU_000044 [Dictyostelium citrinum]